MRMYLRHDSEARRLRLVMADLWNGQHEATEYTVVNDDGTPVRRGAEFDGLTAYSEGNGAYRTRRDSAAGWLSFRTMAGERSETVRTPCRKAGNARRKCELCQVAS